MSDSELSEVPSEDIPTDSVIEASLIKEVKKAAKGPIAEYTVANIRKAAELSLDLPEGFLKEDEKWKSRSKTLIKEQVDKEGETAEIQSKTPRQSNSKENVKRPAKRASPKESSRSNKKRKVDSEEETSALSSPPDDSEDDFEEDVKPKKAIKAKKQTTTPKPKPKSAPKQRPEPKPKSKPSTNRKVEVSDAEENDIQNNGSGEKNDGSDSEMSVLLDEAPVKKPRSKSKSADASDMKPKAQSKSSTEPDADQEEIKRLQGWLIKCGVRKVWGKELKPFGTPKAKIDHLKGMLGSVGMTGRYTNEKAAGLREARELAAEMEAVQEGNERWGKDVEDDDDDDVGDKTRGGRRLVRGAKNYDFLSSDGEETD